MDKDQFSHLQRLQEGSQKVSVDMLRSDRPRTLMYGYDGEKNTFHLYLDDQKVMHSVYYEPAWPFLLLSHESGSDLDVQKCMPNKRVYPERCDFEFCEILKRMGALIPFTSFDEKVRPTTAYHGFLLKDLAETPMENHHLALTKWVQCGAPGVRKTTMGFELPHMRGAFLMGQREMNGLVSEELVSRKDGFYTVTPKGFQFVAELDNEPAVERPRG